MSYATLSALETRFGAEEITQLSDRAGTGYLDATVVATALSDADYEIDAYLAVQYALPLGSVPALLTRIACDIARYRLWEDGASEQVRQGYEDAVDTLKRIASGTVRLSLATSGAVSPSGGIAIQGSTRAFTDTLMAQALI